MATSLTHEIVVLSYNALEETARAIQSLKAHSKGRIIVIDNASEEPVPSWLKTQKDITLILNSENKRYTRGYHDYLKESTADIVTLFNTDCFCEPGWEAPILDMFDRFPRAALVAPLLVTEDGQQVCHAGGVSDFCSHYVGHRGMHFDQPIPRLWMTGACLSIRNAAYVDLGGFDAQFEHYCSDSDLSLRAWFGGWQVWLQPYSVVRHVGGVSTRWEANRDMEKYKKLFDDQKRFNIKWERHGIGIGKREPVFSVHRDLSTVYENPLTAGLV